MTLDHEDFGLIPGEPFEPPLAGEGPFDLSQPHVMTVAGPIPPEALGVCQHHEHVICNPTAVACDDSDWVLDDPHASLAELEAYHVAGGRAMLDASTADYGRDATTMAWIAARSPVHLILVTGHHKALYCASHIEGKTVDQIAAVSIRELREGIDESRVKPGAVKAGSSFDEIQPCEEIALRAAARTHLATGAPITTHTEAGTMALEQLALFDSEGVDLSRVIIGHLDRKLEEPYLRAVLATGAYASFDQISKVYYGPDEPKAAMIRTLVDAGYEDQLLVSQDLARKTLLSAYGGGPGWVYLLERFTLSLMAAGITAGVVRKLLVDNPARALTVRPA
ncbi:MAG: phosphotriesterase-related protein [Chloroflexota bacterium]|nr:phosphotriesterase-related protein [Chloroflexota bacterium]